MGVLQDSEDHAVDEFAEVLAKKLKQEQDADIHRICEANVEAMTVMLNEANDDARTMYDALQLCVRAFEAIRDAAKIPGVALTVGAAHAARTALAESRDAIFAHDKRVKVPQGGRD